MEIKSNEQIENAFGLLKKSLEDIVEAITANLPPLIKRSEEAFEQVAIAVLSLPDNIKAAIIELSKNSWYVDVLNISIPELSDLYINIMEGKVDAVDEYLVKYCDTNLDKLENRIDQKYQNRKIILKKAILAHKNGDYELSIPVILSQVDGICLDATGAEFFYKRYKISKIVNKMANDDPHLLCYLVPFFETSAINDCEDNMKKYPNSINRHEILHGKNTTYANKLNSYKAISLLIYVTSVFTIVKNA